MVEDAGLKAASSIVVMLFCMVGGIITHTINKGWRLWIPQKVTVVDEQLKIHWKKYTIGP